jgi:membrane-associated phospholipid phosphatase
VRGSLPAAADLTHGRVPAAVAGNDAIMPNATSSRAIVFDRPPTSASAIARMAAGALVVAAVGLVLGFAVQAASPVPVEERALAAVAAERSPAATWFFVVLTTLGDLWAVAVLAALATPWLQRRSGGWEAPWLLWASILGALAVTAFIKVVVGRARPLDALVAADSGAFPSGHTSRAAAVLGLGVWAVVLLARHPAVRAGLAALLVSGIGLMGFSRIYLGVHWPTDVLYGFVVGLAWLAAMLLAVRPRVVPLERVPPGAPAITAPG